MNGNNYTHHIYAGIVGNRNVINTAHRDVGIIPGYASSSCRKTRPAPLVLSAACSCQTKYLTGTYIGSTIDGSAKIAKNDRCACTSTSIIKYIIGGVGITIIASSARLRDG